MRVEITTGMHKIAIFCPRNNVLDELPLQKAVPYDLETSLVFSCNLGNVQDNLEARLGIPFNLGNVLDELPLQKAVYDSETKLVISCNLGN